MAFPRIAFRGLAGNRPTGGTPATPRRLLPMPRRRRAPRCLRSICPVLAASALFGVPLGVPGSWPAGGPLGGATASAAQAFDPEEAAIRQLRKVTTVSPGGVHHAVLLALRDLRDPALKPLFQSLVQTDHISIQLGAILGLAELSPQGRVDPWLISQLRSELDRADAVRIGLDLERIGREEIEAMLGADDLPAVGRIVLMAEQRRLGGSPDLEVLRGYAEHDDPAIAGLATCLLMEIGGAESPAAKAARTAFTDRLRGLSARERDAVVEELAAAGRRYRVQSTVDLLPAATAELDLSSPARDAQLGMVLSLRPEAGLTLWQEALRREDSPSARTRLGLLLLVVAPRIPPEAFDALTQGLDPGAGNADLLSAMASAGRAMASGSGRAEALIRLYETGHRRSGRYVIAAAEDLEDAEAAKVYRHILGLAGDPQRRSRELFNDCVDVAARMADRAPEQLKSIMDAAGDDGPQQEAILMGLANARSAAAGDLAKGVRRIGAGRSDSLALLVLARHADKLSSQELLQLGRIAGGGGRLDDTLQAQAAWLWLRHSGRLEAALPKILAGLGGTSGERAGAAPPGQGAGR